MKGTIKPTHNKPSIKYSQVNMQKTTHPQNQKFSSSNRMVTPAVHHKNGEVKKKKQNSEAPQRGISSLHLKK